MAESRRRAHFASLDSAVEPRSSLRLWDLSQFEGLRFVVSRQSSFSIFGVLIDLRVMIFCYPSIRYLLFIGRVDSPVFLFVGPFWEALDHSGTSLVEVFLVPLTRVLSWITVLSSAVSLVLSVPSSGSLDFFLVKSASPLVEGSPSSTGTDRFFLGSPMNKEQSRLLKIIIHWFISVFVSRLKLDFLLQILHRLMCVFGSRSCGLQNGETSIVMEQCPKYIGDLFAFVIVGFGLQFVFDRGRVPLSFIFFDSAPGDIFVCLRAVWLLGIFSVFPYLHYHRILHYSFDQCEVIIAPRI